MSIINSYIPEFKANAYHNGEFKTITDKDVAFIYLQIN